MAEAGAGSQAVEETFADDDGNVYRVVDGEIVGLVDAGHLWRADTRELVEEALAWRARIEADLVALDLRQKATLANFARLRRQIERKLSGWDWRFKSDVVSFARRSLEGKKARTAQYENGAIRFRQSAGTTRILPDRMDDAVKFVESARPDAVKVERSVTARSVLEVAAATGAARPTIAHFLESTGPRETVAIETGVGG